MRTSSHRIGVIALVPDNWNGIWMPRHHIVGRLARWFDVIWLEPAAGWRDYWLNPRSQRNLVEGVAPKDFGLEVSDPGRWLPEVHRPAALGNWLRIQRVRRASQRLRRRGCEKIVLYLWRPTFDWALDAVDADMSCYHIDDEYSFSRDEQPNHPREVRLAQRVDQLIIHSRKLMEKKAFLNACTIQVPNGVEYRAFAGPLPEPMDMHAIPRPRIGYVGVIKAQLDLALLYSLAVRNPQWSFVLVGPTGFIGEKAPLLSKLELLSNTYFMGNRRLAELPAYMHAMDVCTMCYDVCDYTNFIYPLKLNEYLATGRPVVSSAIDAVAGLEPLVRIARGVDEWEDALHAAQSQDALAPESVRARQAQAKKHDWDDLSSRVAEQFRQRLSELAK